MAHKNYGLNELREMFLHYFETKGHLRLPSFPLIPQNDKSLLLINAGMAPMKPWFKGEEEPPRRRVCTCQKCIRTPDIDNIGKTDRHGTYFEMLGNFSFGDYFKKEAIAYCWEFLTSPDWVGLEPDRLYPSVYIDDDEAFEIWNKDIGIAADRISRFGKEDNFWEHGSGPCGPCSEVYYDRGVEHGCGKPDCKVGCDCDRFIEVWNNVFSQFDNDGHNHYTELKQKNIDTGMGLERLACVCQNVGSLFDVDTVRNITSKVSELVGVNYHDDAQKDVSLRIITDHLRASTMMICDGVLPSNEGRGYVLRRLLRRAARHGKLLGVNDPFLYKIVDTVVHENECAYPDLREKQGYITRVIRTEEENFCKTIDGGMKIYQEMLQSHKEKKETVFSGADAFKLYDTFGFPVDLTREMAAEEGMTVDEESFTALMKEQKLRAKAATKALGDRGWAGIAFGKEIPATEFVGYHGLEADGKIVAIVAEDEQQAGIAEGMEGILVLDRTPLYAEMGGQVGDRGRITAMGAEFLVTDVQKNKGGKYMHYGKVVSGEFKLGDEVHASVDAVRRREICRAHTATHLLQTALTRVLGDHVHQAGSLVEPDRLRFDFTHFAAVTPDELRQISACVSDMVLEGVPVETMVLPIAEAKKLGATALFGEKYGETVRVVKMGDCSTEFCGGTHLDNTAKVGAFRIVSEGSVASGVRRIEAITGKAVMEEMDRLQTTLFRAAETLKAPNPAELLHRAEAVIAEGKALKQRLDAMKDRLLSGEVSQILFSGKKVADLDVVTAIRNNMEAADLRKFGDLLRDKNDNIVAVLASVQGEKISILAVCGKNAVARGVKAGLLVKQVCSLCGGSGGGKPDSAMGGGKDALKLDDALATVDDFVLANAK